MHSPRAFVLALSLAALLLVSANATAEHDEAQEAAAAKSHAALQRLYDNLIQMTADEQKKEAADSKKMKLSDTNSVMTNPFEDPASTSDELSPKTMLNNLRARLAELTKTIFERVSKLTKDVDKVAANGRKLVATVSQMKGSLGKLRKGMSQIKGSRQIQDKQMESSTTKLESQLAKSRQVASKFKGELKVSDKVKGAVAKLAANMKMLFSKIRVLAKSIGRVKKEGIQIRREAATECKRAADAAASAQGDNPKPKMSCSCRAMGGQAANGTPMPPSPQMDETAARNLAEQYWGKSLKGKNGAVGGKETLTDPKEALLQTDQGTKVPTNAAAPGDQKKVCFCDDGVNETMELELAYW